MNDQKKIAVLGGGSWATAIVKMLSENSDMVGWYMRSGSAIEHIKENNHNPKYLRAADVYADQLDLSNDINNIVSSYDVLIFAIPSAFLMSELKNLTEPLENKIIFSAIKGIVPETGLIVGEHFHKEHAVPLRKYWRNNRALPRRRGCNGAVVLFNNCQSERRTCRIYEQLFKKLVHKN